MAIEFSYPLYSILLLVITAFSYWFVIKSSLSKYRTIQLLVVRLIALVAIVFSLMGMRAVFTAENNHYVFLVDRSSSISVSDQMILTQINEWKETINEKDVYSVISFTDTIAIELLRADKKTSIINFKQALSPSQTNIQEALIFAQQLLQTGNYNGKIILFTDGNETTGNYNQAVAMIQKSNLKIDILPLDSKIEEDISVLDFVSSDVSYVGETIHLDATISSSVETNATLEWKVNNTVLASTPVQLQEGNNKYRYSYQTDKTGFLNFTVNVLAGKEAFKENNQMSAITQIKDIPKVLVVYEEELFLNNYLNSDKYIVETIHVKNFPKTLSNILQYDSIVFENVSGVHLQQRQMDLIHQAVHDYGVGFIMSGGENSFGLGGYFQTPIEDLLPVQMDISTKRELPSLGLVILVDRSGSMDNGKLELAKEAAVRTVEMLREKDIFGFIAFDDRPWQIVNTEPITNRDKVINAISSLSLGGGTDFQDALNMAITQLNDKDVQRKHIILLTDGQAPKDRLSSIVQKAGEMNITISTVAIGADADRNLLETIAETSKGRMYAVEDVSTIPSILSRETVMMTRTYVEDSPFYPTLVGNSFIKSYVSNGVPQMNAYIATSLKNQARTYLISDKEDPIYATWQYGLGTTIAFTSDISGKWSGDWARWQQWTSFLDSIIRSSFLQMDTKDLATTFKMTGKDQVIQAITNSSSFAKVEASLVSDKGEKLPITIQTKDIGKYEIKMPAMEGIYYLNLTETLEDGSRKNYLTGFTLPYSLEYRPKLPNEELFKNMTEQTNGNILEWSQSLDTSFEKNQMMLQPLTKYLLLISFFAFFLEIVMRRFQLFIPKLHFRSKLKRKSKVTVKQESAINRPIERTIDTSMAAVETEIIEKTKQETLSELLNATKRKK